MPYTFPFGLHTQKLIQEDTTPKNIFVLTPYVTALHAKWKRFGITVTNAIAVANQPRLFWDGDYEEAKSIIDKIHLSEEVGTLEPAEPYLNNAYSHILENEILAPIGCTRDDVWLCALQNEPRANYWQLKLIREKYEPLIRTYSLSCPNIPPHITMLCDRERSISIFWELMKSTANLLILLGDEPINQFLKNVTDVPYSSLNEYIRLYGYGVPTNVSIYGKLIQILPLAAPRRLDPKCSKNQDYIYLHQKWKSLVRY